MGYVRIDPTKSSTVVAGVTIKGFADGDMIIAEYDEDFTTVHAGTQGEYAFITSPVRKGTVTIRVAAYSRTNLALSILAKAPTVGVPIVSTHKSMVADLFSTPAAMLQKVPQWAQGAEAKMVEWVFVFGEAVVAHTGAKEVDFS